MIMIYFDNASTSFPKAAGLGDCVKEHLETSCFNVNRSSYNLALEADGVLYETRDLIAKTFGTNDPRNVIFTSGTTQSVNLALRGLLGEGDVAIASSFEHNAVYRTLEAMRPLGVTPYYVTVSPDLEKTLAEMLVLLRKLRKSITYRSNCFCGTK